MQPLLADSPLSSSFTEEESDVFFWHEGKLFRSSEAPARIKLTARQFEGSSFGMRADHPIRSTVIRIICHPVVGNCILLLILSNCIYMLFLPPGSHVSRLERMTHLDDVVDWSRASEAIEWFVMVTFTIELLLKLLAARPYAYLKDAWNWLDMAVVAPFWVLLAFPAAPSFASLQLARALRPLRTINSLPELRRIVEAFLRTPAGLSL